ncbi:MAG TPA: DUF4388 domain-containing protein [Thermoanaerobaculia bacterium]
MADPQNAEIREAIQELSLYLSDTLPPLVVADSVGTLLNYPPALVAQQIHAWMGTQFRVSTDIPVSDYLFHAVRKIHMMGEFNLVPREQLIAYLEGLKAQVLAFCPEEDRQLLQESFDRLGEPSGSMAPAVDNLLRQRRPAAESASASGQDLLNTRRLSLLLHRLEREVHASGTGALDTGWKDRATTAQTLATAARSARSAQDIDMMLERLRSLGLNLGTSDVFQSIGKNLPGWVPPPSARALPPEQIPSASGVEAMRKIVTLADNPAEGLRRFHEMVRSAIERFNEGSLAQAVTMLELAKRLIEEGAVDRKAAESIRNKEDEDLDVERLRRYAESPEQHPLLRDFLGFFTRLAPEGLLHDLRLELKRERRRLLLLLLEVHGTVVRELVLGNLRTPVGQGAGDEDWYFRRNLLYLLRRIPRPPEVSPEEDVDVAVKHSELKFPAPLVKEAIANLSQLKYEKSEKTLVGLLQDLETMLSKEGEGYDPREARLLIDRVSSALARFGTPGARRAVAEHGLRAKPELGDTMARLAELSGQDLSTDKDLVEKLLASLKANTPFKLFGLVLKKDRNLPSLVEALSGTNHPGVRAAFEEIVKRFQGEEAARIASKALDAFAHAPAVAAAEAAAPGPSLSGDLELFGLPALLQSLAESGTSGVATLRSPKGDVFGTIVLRGGKLKTCQTGKLVGEEAYYQLLERPLPGSFLFARQPDGAAEDAAAGGLRDVLALTLEGMRRFDELQQATALVPDDLVLKPTNVKPTPLPGEKDGILVNDLWTRVSRSATPRQCEAEIKADSYRIRRLLAHWMVSGALAAA